MKNLKKVLALVMVCAMFFTVSSFAFTDVEEDASYLEAVTLLSKLGIINGYEDGTFLPDNTITRAEIAKVLVCALNATEQAEGAKADNIFTDVPASHWAAGYVNYAANMGIINGRGNGIYDPEAPVTYEEAVKLIVAMLGYTPVANVKGGYPTGYLYAANQVMKITKGATGTSGDAAKRWVIARLIYNALECRIMEQETWSAADPEFIKGSDTLLDDYLNITKLEAVITGTFLQAEALDKEVQTINFEVSKVDGKAVAEDEATLDIEANGTGAEEYLGYTVVAYVENYEDADAELVAVAPKAGKNSTLQVALGDFDAASRKGVDAKSYFTVDYFADEDATKTIKIADDDNDGVDVVYYENGLVSEGDLYADLADYGEDYGDDEGENDGIITFLDNDGNGVYDYAFLERLSSEMVVDEINAKKFRVTAKESNEVETFDPEDEELLVTFYKDGKVASFDDIAEGDVLSIVAGWCDDAVKKVYISSKKVEGYISATSNDTFKIDGTFYAQSSFSVLDGLTLARREEGTFYINYNGKIAYVEKTAEVGGNYGFALATNTNVSFSNGVDYTLRFMNTKGEWIDATLAETVTYTAWDGTKWVSTKLDTEDEIQEESKLSEATNGWLILGDDVTDEIKEIELADATNSVFQYALNSNGELTKIVVAKEDVDDTNFSYSALGTRTDAEATEDIYDALGNRFKNTPLKGGVDKNTVVFTLDLDGADLEATTTLKKSQVSVADYTMFEDDETYEGYVYDYANDAYKCMVITNVDATIADNAKFLVVKSVEIVANEDDEEYVIIEGYMDGEKVTLETVADEVLESAIDVTGLDEGENFEDLEDYDDGAVFEVALNGEGKITDINVVFAGKAAFAEGAPEAEAIVENAEDELYVYFGAIYSEKAIGSSKYIQLCDFAEEATALLVDEAEVEIATAGSSMKGNIYNVDLTGRTKFNVVDSIAEYVDCLILDAEDKVTFGGMNPNSEVHFVLAKVLEDETIDIVVYTLKYADLTA